MSFIILEAQTLIPTHMIPKKVLIDENGWRRLLISVSIPEMKNVSLKTKAKIVFDAINQLELPHEIRAVLPEGIDPLSSEGLKIWKAQMIGYIVSQIKELYKIRKS